MADRARRVTLVLLRIAIGWQFLYEGYYKLMVPGWSRLGQRLPEWTASGYLSAATGPFENLFHSLASPPAIVWIDRVVPIALAAVGLSLILGLFTQLGLLGAFVFLATFYVSAIPTRGVPEPFAEGTYLFVNKNLVEALAVLALLASGTGAIAGLDLLIRDRMPSWLGGHGAAREAERETL